MPISITNLQAEFAATNFKKVEIEFGGGQAPNREGAGRHSAESDAVRGNGGQFSFPDQDLDLSLDSSNTLVVVAKVSKTLLPDKTIGEGRVQLTSDGPQQVQISDAKTGGSAGIVSFTVTSRQSATGRAQQAVTGNPNAGYNNTPAGAGGVGGAGAGVGGVGNQGYGQQQGGGGYGNTGGVGNTGGGQFGGAGGSGVGGGVGGGTVGQPQGAGFGQGGGQGGIPGRQEMHEQRTHNVSHHDENETYSKDVV